MLTNIILTLLLAVCQFNQKEHQYTPSSNEWENCDKVVSYIYDNTTPEYQDEMDLCVYHDPDYLTPLLDEQGNFTN